MTTQAQLVLKTTRVICSGRLTRTKVIHNYEAKVIKLTKLTKVNATLTKGRVRVSAPVTSFL